MNEKKLNEEFGPEDFEEFPEEIPDKAKPNLNEEEKRLRKQIYAN